MSTTQPVDFPLPAPPDLYRPSPEYAELRAASPVSRVRLPDGKLAWLVTGHAGVRMVLTDRRFSRAAASATGTPDLGLGALAAQSILGMDPPEHTRLRKLVVSAFTHRRVTELRPRIEQIVTGLLDRMETMPRPVDLVESFSLPLPVQVICEMLGVPAADRHRFHALSDAMLGGLDADPAGIMGSFAKLGAYLMELIEAKRREPADDLLSALIAARDEGDRLSETELVILGVSLLVAGHETTANQLNMCVLTLLHEPDELRRLRERPELLPTAVEELMRFVQLGDGVGLVRVATDDVEVCGVTIAEGDAVMTVGRVANRDPEVFAEPDRLDLSRAPNPHLAFGAGVHHCLGAQLARAELEIALGALIRRFPGLRVVVPDGELRFKRGMQLRSLEALPVTW